MARNSDPMRSRATRADSPGSTRSRNLFMNSPTPASAVAIPAPIGTPTASESTDAAAATAGHVASDAAFAGASWIGPPGSPELPGFWEFSVEFAWPSGTLTLYVTADQRFKLYIGDIAIARGPECGTLMRWYYHRLHLELPAGRHQVRALVWSLGDLSPYAHVSLRPAFLLAAQGAARPLLTTGVAEWRVARRHDHRVVTTRNPPGAHFIGPSFDLDASLQPSPPTAAEMLGPAVARKVNGRLSGNWRLVPAELPQPTLERWTMWRVCAAANIWLRDGGIVDPSWCSASLATHANNIAQGRTADFPAHCTYTALLDTEHMVTAYAGLETSGGRGAVIDLAWAESLVHETEPVENAFVTHKGHRDEVAGKHFRGFGDTFRPAGGHCRFETPWWRAGRYLLVRIRTAEEPLRIERLLCVATGYEFESHARFEATPVPLGPVLALCERGLRASCHEVYADSPAYEQQMYAGDARIEILVHRCLETDDRLARKAVQLFGESRHAGAGWTWSRCPSRVGQVIPAFSLIYILMVDDFMCWHNDTAFVRTQISAMRSILDVVEGHLDDDGLLAGLPGWHFIDWCLNWENGVPPSDGAGRSTPVNLFHALALQAAARVERALGSMTRARHLVEIGDRVAAGLRTRCFDAALGLFADAPGISSYSEQTQALAVLALGRDVAEKRAWLAASRHAAVELAPSSYYFDHYVFEAHREARDPAFFSRLQRWTALVEKGVLTPIESAEPNRSDCHAWASHPLFHAYATIAGIRPSSRGPSVVTIAPLPGPLRTLEVELPWFGGSISLKLEFDLDRAMGTVSLPPGVQGEFVFGDLHRSLAAGPNVI